MKRLDTLLEALTCIDDVPPQMDREHAFIDEYLSDREIGKYYLTNPSHTLREVVQFSHEL